MTDTTSKYAPSVWGKEAFQDLEVPSGQLCKVRMPGIQAMITAGILQSADTLTSLVDKKHIKRVAGKSLAKANEPEIDAKSLLSDSGNMQRVFDMVDRVTEYMVVEPDVRRPIKTELHPDSGKAAEGETIEVPMPNVERVDGVIYTEMIDIQDKMYIFQYAVGGDTDLERFRERFATGVGSVAPE